VSGTAEGIVNGERVSMPLRIVKLVDSGLSAVWWSQPRDGVSMLNFRIAKHQLVFHRGVKQNPFLVQWSAYARAALNADPSS